MGWHLNLVQGQMHEGASTQSLHIPWFLPKHGVEVKHGRLLLTKESIAASSGEEGLTGLAP